MNISSYLKNLMSVGAGSSTSDTERKLKEYEDFYKEQMGLLDKSTGSLPEPPSYERIEYDEPSDEEIKSSAEAELSDYARSGEQSIRDEYAKKENDLKKSRTSGEALYGDSSQKLSSAYEQAAEALGNDALKRGLARSSIAVNKQAEAGRAYAQGMQDLISERNNRLNEIDDEISSLNEQLNNALDSFKISYAAKLTERMNELKAKREKDRAEAIKYNNSLLKDEYDQEVARQKANSSSSSATKTPTGEQKSKIDRQVYEKATELLDSLPFEQARELFMNNSIFKDTLSDYYYYKLNYKYR